MLKVILLILTFNCANGSLDDFAMPQYSAALSVAISDITQNFYMDFATTVYIFHGSETKEDLIRNEGTINEILYNMQGKIVFRIDHFSEMRMTKRKRQNCIIFLDTIESFMEFVDKLNPESFEYQGFYTIAIANYHDEIYGMMTKMFEVLWAQYIVNVNILWMPPENDAEVLMWTYWPYSSSYCGKAIPLKHDHYRNDGWIRKVDFFPNKMTNLHGCVLHAATFINPPFMIINEREDGLVNVDGIDGIMLRVLAQKMNFNVQLHITNELWGGIYDNGTATGAIKKVLDKEVNLTLGYFATTAARDFAMKSSSVYYTSNLVWAIPPGRENSPLEKLSKPFQLAVWIFFLITLALSFIVVGVLQMKFSKNVQNFVFGKNVYDPWLNIVNIIFGGSLPSLPTRNFARTVLAIYMIYCFIIQNSYKGSLFQFMSTTVREKEVTTVDEMLKENFKFYMMASSKDLLTNMPQVLERAVFKSRTDFTKMFDEVVKPEFKGGLLTSVDHIAYRNIQASPHKFFRHAPEVIMTYNIVIYMHKQTCLGNQFDNMIIQLVNGGLVRNWASKFIDPMYLKRAPTSKTRALNITQVSGAFQLFVAGLLLSFFVLLYERFSARGEQRKILRIPFTT